jgi:hypothetical protein
MNYFFEENFTNSGKNKLRNICIDIKKSEGY